MNDIGNIALAIAKLRHIQISKCELSAERDKIEKDIVILKNLLSMLERRI